MIDKQTATTIDFTIDMTALIRSIFVFSLLLQCFFIVADLVFNYMDILDEKNIRRIWNVARENSLPTWYASLQAHCVAITIFGIAAIESRYAPRWKVWGWVLIGLFFLWIGIDDFAEIHEKLGTSIENLIQKHVDDKTGLIAFLLKNPSYNWQTFLAPVFALCGVAITLFLWSSFRHLNIIHFLVLGFSLWIISQGLDYLEGLPNIKEQYRMVQDYFGFDRFYLVTHGSKLIEEEMEMLGTTLLWMGFLHYLRHISDGVRFTFVKSIDQN